MKIQIKKIGCSIGVVLPAPLCKFHDLKEGDWIDLSDIFKLPDSPVEFKELKDVVK